MLHTQKIIDEGYKQVLPVVKQTSKGETMWEGFMVVRPDIDEINLVFYTRQFSDFGLDSNNEMFSVIIKNPAKLNFEIDIKKGFSKDTEIVVNSYVYPWDNSSRKIDRELRAIVDFVKDDIEKLSSVIIFCSFLRNTIQGAKEWFKVEDIAQYFPVYLQDACIREENLTEVLPLFLIRGVLECNEDKTMYRRRLQ